MNSKSLITFPHRDNSLPSGIMMLRRPAHLPQHRDMHRSTCPESPWRWTANLPQHTARAHRQQDHDGDRTLGRKRPARGRDDPLPGPRQVALNRYDPKTESEYVSSPVALNPPLAHWQAILNRVREQHSGS